MPGQALYYPNWSIDDPMFLFESLLYWDRLACIVPYHGFTSGVWKHDEDLNRVMNKAHEQYVDNYLPTDEQKRHVHERVAGLVNREAPAWWQPGNLSPEQRGNISSEKLLPETVRLLHDNGWMVPDGSGHMNDISGAAANVVMAAIAEECSSENLPPITDDPGSFATSCNLLLREMDSANGLARDEDRDEQNQPTGELAISIGQGPSKEELSFLLTAIPHLGLEDNKISPPLFDKLLVARQKPDVEGLRAMFRAKIDEYIQRLRQAPPPERELIRREFLDKATADLYLLNKELRSNGLKTLFSKEGLIGATFGVALGAFFPPLVAVAPSLGIASGLGSGLPAYHEGRRARLKEHWTSWIFTMKHPRFSVW